MSENKLRTIEAMIKDVASYTFISDVIKSSGVGKTTFYKYFSPEEIGKLRTGE